MPETYEISFSALRTIFEQFNAAIKSVDWRELKWDKLEYCYWQRINKYLKAHERGYAIIIYKTNEVVISSHLDGESCVFKRQKNGFSKFLLTELKEGYKKSMITTTGSTYTTAGSNLTYTTTAIPNDYITTTTNTYTVNYPDTKDPRIKIDKNGIFIDGKKVLTEEEPMTNKDFGLNFDFGPVTDNKLAVCPFGIAAKNAEGNYCYYNPNTCEVVDCTPFTFDTKKFLFKMPVAVSAIAVGDVIMHHGIPMFVKGVEDNEGRVVAIDITNSEEKYILPTKNIFGFNFITKIVSLLDMTHCGASADTPFGNMLPMLLLMKDGKDLDPMMLLMMSGINGSGNMNVFGNLAQNPLMMYMVMQENTDLSKMLPFMLMTNQLPKHLN